MRLTPLQQIDLWGRNAVPLLLTVFLVMVGAVPFPVSGVAAAPPMLGLAAFFYWAIYRPGLLGFGAAAGLGLFHDLLNGIPIGVTSLVYVLVYGLMTSQRRYFVSTRPWVLWAVFAPVALGASTLNWFLGSVLAAAPLPATAFLVAALVTLAIYPVVAWLCGRAYQILPEEL